MSNWNYTKEEIELLRDKVVIEAKKLINVPFSHRGRTRFGIDCLGLVWLAYRKAGISSIPDGDGKIYEPNWYWFCDKERYLDNLLKFSVFVEEPIKADVPLFKCYKDMVTHGGIYIGDRDFVHAPSGRKVTIESLDHRYWNKRFAGFLRFKGFIREE